eukprot:GEMP01001433.1.p1 GENE.GEMP01001433.1~~GEMP01001433.1.p1  ORF type:complete len:1266 (+),score=284.15 GEMP01001433.1:232-4029(+)
MVETEQSMSKGADSLPSERHEAAQDMRSQHQTGPVEVESLSEAGGDRPRDSVAEVGSMELDEAIAATIKALSPLIQRPRLTVPLLAKPRFKFLRDVFKEVRNATSFAIDIVTDEDIEKAPENRETKVQFLTLVIQLVIYACNEPDLANDIRASKIVSGLAAEKTNLLLQKLAAAAQIPNSLKGFERSATERKDKRGSNEYRKDGSECTDRKASAKTRKETGSKEHASASGLIESEMKRASTLQEAEYVIEGFCGKESVTVDGLRAIVDPMWTSEFSPPLHSVYKNPGAPARSMPLDRRYKEDSPPHRRRSDGVERPMQDNSIAFDTPQKQHQAPAPSTSPSSALKQSSQSIATNGLSKTTDVYVSRLCKVPETTRHASFAAEANENMVRSSIAPKDVIPVTKAEVTSWRRLSWDNEIKLATSSLEALWFAIREPSTIDMSKVRYILQNEKSIKLSDPLSQDVPPPLFFAASIRDLELIKVLIVFHADVNQKYAAGVKSWRGLTDRMTPLEYVTGMREYYKMSKRKKTTEYANKCEAIEHFLIEERDRSRGWGTGRRLTKTMTCPPCSMMISMPSPRNPPANVDTSDDSDDDSDSSLPSYFDTDPETATRTSAALTPPDVPLGRRKSLYHCTAAVVLEHIEGNPGDTYEFLSIIGEGTFGSVRKARHREYESTMRAIKSIPKFVLEESGLWQEIEVLRTIDHPSIMRLHSTYEDKHYIYMICELCAGGELLDVMTKLGNFDEHLAAIVMKQIVGAVYYLHGKFISHRDLKPENFLLSTPCQTMEDLYGAQVKMIDLGTAKFFSGGREMTTKICTLHYVAPEVLSSRVLEYTEKVDMWSTGVITFLMLSGNPPFDSETDAEILRAIKRGRFNFEPREIWEEISEEAKDWVSRLLQVKPNIRLSAHMALNHPWIHDNARNPLRGSRKLSSAIVDNMRSFRAHNRLKKLALQIIAQSLSDDVLDKLRSQFMELDRENKGVLKANDILEKIRSTTDLSIDDQVEMYQVLYGMDSDGQGQGEVNYSQFLAATIDRKHYLEEEKCRGAFNIVDMEGDGLIDREELFLVLGGTKGLSDEALGAEVDQIIAMADKDQDGMMNFEEFMAMMRNEVDLYTNTTLNDRGVSDHGNANRSTVARKSRLTQMLSTVNETESGSRKRRSSYVQLPDSDLDDTPFTEALGNAVGTPSAYAALFKAIDADARSIMLKLGDDGVSLNKIKELFRLKFDFDDMADATESAKAIDRKHSLKKVRKSASSSRRVELAQMDLSDVGE